MVWIGRLARMLVALGVLSALWGVVYTVNGITQAGATVKVPVTLTPVSTSGWGDVPVQVDGIVVPGWLAGARPDEGTIGTADGRLTLAVWGSTAPEQVLRRAGVLVLGLGLLVAGFALHPVLESIAAGRPFVRGTARRIAVVAGCVAVVGTLAPVLPQVAGFLVLERIGLAGPRFLATPSVPLAPLVVAALVLVVAAAFRAAERMSDELSGLV